MYTLTKEIFDTIKAGDVFATGNLPNSPEGLYMSDNGGDLRWLAKKGYGNDWAIYCHWVDRSDEWIESHGDKVIADTHIKKCVTCTDEVFGLYRY